MMKEVKYRRGMDVRKGGFDYDERNKETKKDITLGSKTIKH